MGSVASRTVALQRHPRFVFGTYEYVTSHGKRDFAGVTELRTLRWEIILDLQGGSKIWVLKSKTPSLLSLE